MFEIVKLFLEISFLKKGPQDVPYSKWLFQFSMLLYIVTGFFILYLSTDLVNAVSQLAVEVILILSFTWGLLKISGDSKRYIQSVTALFGTDAVVSFFALPVLGALVSSQGSKWAFILLLFAMIWHLVVTGHIYHHVLSKSFSFGLGVAFLYILFSYWLMDLLFAPVVDG